MWHDPEELRFFQIQGSGLWKSDFQAFPVILQGIREEMGELVLPVGTTIIDHHVSRACPAEAWVQFEPLLSDFRVGFTVKY